MYIYMYMYIYIDIIQIKMTMSTHIHTYIHALIRVDAHIILWCETRSREHTRMRNKIARVREVYDFEVRSYVELRASKTKAQVVS